MRPQPAGKQPVAIGHMHHIPRAGAAGAQGTGNNARPCVQIALGIADNRRLAGGAG